MGEQLNIDEKGFVFLDERQNPYLCALWKGEPWLFYWHAENRWVSLRPVSQKEILSFPNNLTTEQQEIYGKQHMKNSELGGVKC